MLRAGVARSRRSRRPTPRTRPRRGRHGASAGGRSPPSWTGTCLGRGRVGGAGGGRGQRLQSRRVICGRRGTAGAWSAHPTARRGDRPHLGAGPAARSALQARLARAVEHASGQPVEESRGRIAVWSSSPPAAAELASHRSGYRGRSEAGPRRGSRRARLGSGDGERSGSRGARRQVSARIALTVAEGARVKRGDVLVRLSDDDVRATPNRREPARGRRAQVRRIRRSARRTPPPPPRSTPR